jgi:hypothetical protein
MYISHMALMYVSQEAKQTIGAVTTYLDEGTLISVILHTLVLDQLLKEGHPEIQKSATEQ